MNRKEKELVLRDYCIEHGCTDCLIGDKTKCFIAEGRLSIVQEEVLDGVLEVLNSKEGVYRKAWETLREGQKKDNVNHPSHYETGNFECIEVMQETQGTKAVKNFCICNAFKYLYRHNKKNGTEDIKKAIWYLNMFIELEEE